MNKDKVLLAIDGGATKTAVKVVREDSKELLSIKGQGSNYQAIGVEKVENELSRLLTEVATHNLTIDAAVFAIAGIDTQQDLTIVQQIVKRSIATSSLNISHYTVENDVEATMRGLCGNKPGALIISGTGAIGYSFDGSQTFRVGGWGHRIGDEGSGYWIGQAIVQAVFKAMDGRGEKTILTESVLASQNFANIDELMNWIYRNDYRNADLANFASLLQQAVNANDTVAKKIAERAANELASLAIALLKPIQHKLNSSFICYLNGGALLYNDSIYKQLEQHLQSFAPAITVKRCEQKPIDAIVARANTL